MQMTGVERIFSESCPCFKSNYNVLNKQELEGK